MHSGIRKIAAAVLTASVLFSFTGCAFKPYQKAYGVADEFAKAIVNMDPDTILELAGEGIDEDDISAINSFFSYKDVAGKDNRKFIDDIAATLSYQIDVDTLTTSGDKGTVNVIFTVADWEEAFRNGFVQDYSSAKDVLADADTTDISVKAQLEKTDGNWYVTNACDIVEEICSFTGYHYIINIEKIDDAYWSGNEEGYGYTDVYESPDTIVTYHETDKLALYIYLTEYTDRDSTYYTYERDGSIIYTSSRGTTLGILELEDCPGAENGEYIPEGSYTIRFFVGDECVFVGRCIVE